MNNKINLFIWLRKMFKEFLVETASKPQYEIADLYECEKTGFTKAVIKLSSRHSIEKNISDIVIDNDLIEGLDKKTIRTLTYMATIERMKPDFSIIFQELNGEVDEYILAIKSKNDNKTIKKSPSEVTRDKVLLARFSPYDANRIGYLAGMCETTKEYQMKR